MYNVITAYPIKPGLQSLKMGFKSESNDIHSRWQAMMQKKGLMGSTRMVWMILVNFPKHVGDSRKELLASLGRDSNVRESIHEDAKDT